MKNDEFDSQQRDLLAMLSASLWVLEHPEVNKIKFCGNPKELAKRIREKIEASDLRSKMPKNSL